MNIIDLEQPKGVVQFGGQTAINLADKLAKHDVQILGTSLEDLNRAEDRKEFEALLNKLVCHNQVDGYITSRSTRKC